MRDLGNVETHPIHAVSVPLDEALAVVHANVYDLADRRGTMEQLRRLAATPSQPAPTIDVERLARAMANVSPQGTKYPDRQPPSTPVSRSQAMTEDRRTVSREELETTLRRVLMGTSYVPTDSIGDAAFILAERSWAALPDTDSLDAERLTALLREAYTLLVSAEPTLIRDARTGPNETSLRDHFDAGLAARLATEALTDSQEPG